MGEGVGEGVGLPDREGSDSERIRPRISVDHLTPTYCILINLIYYIHVLHNNLFEVTQG